MRSFPALFKLEPIDPEDKLRGFRGSCNPCGATTRWNLKVGSEQSITNIRMCDDCKNALKEVLNG